MNKEVLNNHLKIDGISRKERNNSIHPETIAVKWGQQ
jgi:hypothetical protein